MRGALSCFSYNSLILFLCASPVVQCTVRSQLHHHHLFWQTTMSLCSLLFGSCASSSRFFKGNVSLWPQLHHSFSPFIAVFKLLLFDCHVPFTLMFIFSIIEPIDQFIVLTSAVKWLMICNYSTAKFLTKISSTCCHVKTVIIWSLCSLSFWQWFMLWLSQVINSPGQQRPLASMACEILTHDFSHHSFLQFHQFRFTTACLLIFPSLLTFTVCNFSTTNMLLFH